MCSFSKKLRSTVLITAVVLFGGTYQVWAFPSRHIASPAGHSVVIHLCKPGNKNCNPVTGGTPVPCSKTHADRPRCLSRAASSIRRVFGRSDRLLSLPA